LQILTGIFVATIGEFANLQYFPANLHPIFSKNYKSPNQFKTSFSLLIFKQLSHELSVVQPPSNIMQKIDSLNDTSWGVIYSCVKQGYAEHKSMSLDLCKGNNNETPSLLTIGKVLEQTINRMDENDNLDFLIDDKGQHLRKGWMFQIVFRHGIHP